MAQNKNNLTNLDSYITLDEAVKLGYWKKSFLEMLIKNGKLKAMKMGDDWMTTEEFVIECRERVKGDLETEIENELDTDNSRKWVHYRKSKLPWLKWRLPFFASATAVVAILLLGVLQILAFGTSKNVDYFVTSMDEALEIRYEIGEKFLLATHRVFGLPVVMINSSHNIPEKMTNLFSWVNPGDWEKISDEAITENWHNGLDSSAKWQALRQHFSSLTGKSSSGQVAGAGASN